MPQRLSFEFDAKNEFVYALKTEFVKTKGLTTYSLVGKRYQHRIKKDTLDVATT